MLVVAVGGSVTTGMGALRLEDSYPHRIVAWLRSLGGGAHAANVEVCSAPQTSTLHYPRVWKSTRKGSRVDVHVAAPRRSATWR